MYLFIYFFFFGGGGGGLLVTTGCVCYDLPQDDFFNAQKGKNTRQTVETC